MPEERGEGRIPEAEVEGEDGGEGWGGGEGEEVVVGRVVGWAEGEGEGEEEEEMPMLRLRNDIYSWGMVEGFGC